ncbi:serine/threonine-protein kinase, partial [Streptomyces sp. NPDC004050]
RPARRRQRAPVVPTSAPVAAAPAAAVPPAVPVAVPPAGFGPPPPAESFQQPHHTPAPHPGFPPQGGPSEQPPSAAVHATGATATDRARRRGRVAIAVAVVAVLATGGVTYAMTNGGGGARRQASATPPATGPEQQASGGASGAAGPEPSPSGTRAKPSATASKKPGTASPSPKASASAAPAQPSAVPTGCAGWTHKDPKPGTYGYISGDHHLLAAPYQNCTAGALVKDGTKLWYHCYVVNRYGNQWTYVRVEGTNTTGWLYNRDLTGQKGSSPAC